MLFRGTVAAYSQIYESQSYSAWVAGLLLHEVTISLWIATMVNDIYTVANGKNNDHKKHIQDDNRECWLRYHRGCKSYRSSSNSLAQTERKQATATEDFEFHISYL